MVKLIEWLFKLVASIIGFSVWFIFTCWKYAIFVVIAVIATAFMNS